VYLTIVTAAFHISQVAAYWHELMIPRRIMRPSIVRNSEQLDPHADIPPPQSATLGLHTIAHDLLLISRPTEGMEVELAGAPSRL